MSQSIFERPGKPRRRVVVTGMSAITPLGSTLDKTWERLIAGKSGIDKITAFDASAYDCQIAGEVKDFNVDEWVDKKEQKKMDRFIHFSMACAKMALQDANLETMDDATKARTGVIIGVGIGGLGMIEKQNEVLKERGPGRITPFFIPAVITNLAAGQVSIKYGLKGPNYSVTSACASSAHSLGEAARYIQNGDCDIMLAGGSEAVVTPLAIGGFSAMRAMSTRNDNPQAASRPWDKDRDGFVLAEGAALMVLEDYEHAQKRGAKIYAELVGYGTSSDGFHMTTPAPGGAGAAMAMHLALKDANLDPSKVDYINAHGTSTPAGDELESNAIKKVFGDHAKKLLVSSTKSMTGHTLGAAGGIESVICVKAMQHSIVPPTINLENPSDDCDLDYVPGKAREKKLNTVLNNSFGFGGTNACLIFSRI